MKLIVSMRAACAVCGLLFISSTAAAQNAQQPLTRVDRISLEIRSADSLAISGHAAEAQNVVLRAYLDDYEPLEAEFSQSAAAGEIKLGESAFHAVMENTDPAELPQKYAALNAQLIRVRSALAGQSAGAEKIAGAQPLVDPNNAGTREVRSILQQLRAASNSYAAGDHARALALVEHTYLEQFEPLESRLPRPLVDRAEKLIHLQLRPAIKSGASVAKVNGMLGALGNEMSSADRFLRNGGSAWFAIVNSFVIIVREGLEAVLLIAALLAYLGAIGAGAKHRRQIYGGMAAGVVASIGTWFLASTLLPISGANRELIEGVTALLAVAVLLYVAHWLFQKTYIHDWKDYLRTRVGGAVTRGSALAMAALAFAAVYREGFETVLFYQALAFDSGVAAILAGFIPGALLITLIGVGIIRAGMKLPLKKVFAGTNAVLMYLAFVFIGKGLYNLQEAGVFSPHPLRLPDHPALRQLLGFYPLVETIGAQVVFLLLLTITYLYYRRTMMKKAGASGQPASKSKRVVA
jgi:FTR1 family protein